MDTLLVVVEVDLVLCQQGLNPNPLVLVVLVVVEEVELEIPHSCLELQELMVLAAVVVVLVKTLVVLMIHQLVMVEVVPLSFSIKFDK
jgi:hypothetical protein